MPKNLQPEAWQERVELAEHYKAVGWTDNHFLGFNEFENKPWGHTTSVSSSSKTSLDFEAEIAGLTFRWHIDVYLNDEVRERNAFPIVDVLRVRRIVGLLPADKLPMLKEALAPLLQEARNAETLNTDRAVRIMLARKATEALL